MLSEQLKKILKLIKKTGDRVIFFDASFPEESFVIMGLDRYTTMVDNDEAVKPGPVQSANLTDEDLTDKINREISTWKNKESGAELAEESGPGKTWKIPPTVINNAENIE